MTETIAIDFRNPFPVFPLPDAVLFPHTLMPLHIFEPRYRRMVSDALDGFGFVAMALFDGAVSAEDYLRGQPRLRPIVSIGHIRHYEKLADGRFLILLHGVCRARIREEVEHEPYRLFKLDPVDIETHPEQPLRTVRALLRTLVGDPAVRARMPTGTPLPDGDELPTPALIEALISELCRDVEQRYRLLAEPDIQKRGAWLIGALRALRTP